MDLSILPQSMLYLALAIAVWSFLGVVGWAEAYHHHSPGPIGPSRGPLPGSDEQRLSARTSDSQGQASWDQTWDETIRAACRVMREAPGRVRSIHVVGETWSNAESGQLKRFIELAAAAATDFGVIATVGYEHGHPCFHLAHRPRYDLPRRVGLNTEKDSTPTV